MALNPAQPKSIVKLDESVINKICAGEVIHRPVNVVKELIENSLDAGATNISVTLHNGGLRSITIQDNGCGIKKDELEIVCNRFTTSKLNTFDDMLRLSTFGFRGEALSSISTVSHLTIVTQTALATCGYKAEYIDGQLKPNTSVQPVPASQGTIIVVENLFYNMPTRKAALSSEATEFNLIQDLITKYAILHSQKCAFRLRKSTENTAALNTTLTSSLLNNINNIFSQNVSTHLIHMRLEDEKLNFSLEGYFSNGNLNMKRFQFLLFINQRLVDCAPLKKSIKDIYKNYLMKAQNPFIMINLKIASNKIDVNVHPTKSEVCFLHQEEIFDIITKRIEEKLREADTNQLPPQNSYSKLPNQSISNNVSNLVEKSDRLEKESREESHANSFQKVSNLIQTKLFNNSREANASHHSPKNQNMNKPGTSKQPYKQVRTDNKEQRILQYVRQKADLKNWRKFDLGSLRRLRGEVYKNSDNSLLEIIMESTFVGCVDEKYILLQNENDLLLAESHSLNQELFYQVVLADFGNFDYIALEEPFSIVQLLLTYLKVNTPNIINAEENAQLLMTSVMNLVEMLNDYFSIEIDTQHGTIKALPQLLEGHFPNMSYMPDFVYRLCSNVNWEEEEACFRDVATELATFYARPPQKLSTDDEYQQWSSQFSEAIYPLYKTLFLPSTKLEEQKIFQTIVNTNDLYRVFERC